jgi:cytochrome c oxidase subunit IV
MAHKIDVDAWERKFKVVLFVLVVGTMLTVAASYLHLPSHIAIPLALAIAIAKGSFVVLYFMHLIDEKQLIYWVMAIAVLFFFFELFIPMFTEGNTYGAALATGAAPVVDTAPHH